MRYGLVRCGPVRWGNVGLGEVGYGINFSEVENGLTNAPILQAVVWPNLA